ncbi:hypothetical protein B0H11DRAFT_2118244 [Mycena galericulata]|nr:hypothetical protein B0H11DRAFT_2118244 [Mycena galericulata]
MVAIPTPPCQSLINMIVLHLLSFHSCLSTDVQVSHTGSSTRSPLTSPSFRVWWDHLAERPWACTRINIPTQSQYPAARASNDLSILEATPFSDLAGLRR